MRELSPWWIIGAALLVVGGLTLAVASIQPLGGSEYAADAAFFGGLLAFAVVGSLHQDARKLATGVPGYREFHDATVLVPFTGEGLFQGLRELSPWAVVIGVSLTVVLRVFHGTLFGS